MKFETECVYTGHDLRKARYSNSYVKALEEHIALLEKSFKDLKETTDDDEKNKILNSLPLDNIMPNDLQPSPSPSSTLQIPLFNNSRIPSAVTLPSVGTNSIYPSNSLSITKKKTPTDQQLQTKSTLENLSKDPLILEAFSLFFKWLYPGHFMFIHRETFLSAFFNMEDTKSYYCSEELVYAIAALGGQISKKSEKLYANMDAYYQRAKLIVLKKIFQLDDKTLEESTSSSKLAIIQTLLCLAFYDIGIGENPMAWYLSGLAFRIAHEIGLHLNPEAWSHVYEDELSVIDTKVRSRIYWGSYIADHLIAILFGRSTTLRLSNSTVPETDELPNIENGLEDYIYDKNAVSTMSNPLKKLIVLSRITEVFAGKIFIQSESLRRRSEYLTKFNLEMYHWRRDLPKDLRWSKKSLKVMEDFNPSTTYIWFHYYMVLISYNKPFIAELDPSRDLIEEYIEELHYLLIVWKNKFKTFEKCNLYLVYLIILAIQCMNTDLIKKDHYTEFIDFLNNPTLNYELAKKFIENSNNTNNNDVNTDTIDLLGSLSYGTDFALEYNFDFTLLNEIDMLIGGTTHGVGNQQGIE